MPQQAQTAGTGHEVSGGHIAIPTASLRVDEVTDFDLYLRQAEDAPPVLYRAADLPFTRQPRFRCPWCPVLYRAADLPFTGEARDRLRAAAVDQLYIVAADRPNYQRYLERHLGRIVRDNSLPLEERSATLYFSAKELVRDLMRDPRAGDLPARSANVVEHTVGLLFNEGQSFRHLMQVTSYDYYTYTHSVNVFVFGTALVQRLGHPESVAREFGQGALLHDIGKSRVPADIVNAKGKLNEAQWAEMRRHPEHGWDILRGHGVSSPIVLDVTRHHHEKLNGTGYPDGLRGGDISPWARIATIADIFDALTTRRSYKEALNSFPGLQLMRDHMRDEIDMDFFRAFVDLMARP